jgi:hypothetical protein
MQVPHFRITWLMAFVAIVALDLAAIRELDLFNDDLRFGGGPNFNRIEFLGLGALPMANILVVGLLIALWRRKSRPFLLGFELFGAVALGVYLVHNAVWSLYRVAYLWPIVPWVMILLKPLNEVLRIFGGGDILSYHIIFHNSVVMIWLALPQVAFALIGGFLTRGFAMRLRRMTVRQLIVGVAILMSSSGFGFNWSTSSGLRRASIRRASRAMFSSRISRIILLS